MKHFPRCLPPMLHAVLPMVFACSLFSSVAMADHSITINGSSTALAPVPNVDHARIAENDIPHFSYSAEQTDATSGDFASALLPTPQTSTFLVVMLAVFTVLGSRSFMNAKRRDS